MKSFVLLLCCIFGGSALTSGADPAQVESVYLLPMSGGLDQFLANRLTGTHLLRVVADPNKADAVFTDHLGAEFEARLNELYPPPEPPKPDKPAKSEDAAKTDTAAPDEPRVRFTTFGRGKGTLFLVSAKTRTVLWSTFEKPKNNTASQLDRTAARIVDRLKESLKGK